MYSRTESLFQNKVVVITGAASGLGRQLAFHLADKYRNPVVVLTDGILGQMMEPLDVKTLDFGPLPEKDWALRGQDHHKDGRRRALSCLTGTGYQEVYPSYLEFMRHLDKKYQQMELAMRTGP